MIILHLTPGFLRALGPHRTRPGWEVCEENGSLWLRCPPDATGTAAALPCLARYRTDAAGRLIPLHATLPVGRAPAGPWHSLADFLTVQPLPALLPGRPPEKAIITMERSSHEVAPGAVLAAMAGLAAWAEQASRLRFAPLKFAAASDGRVFVCGTPLPPVPGTPCYFHGPLALPCGWDFAPPLWPGWVEQALALAPGEVALIDASARVEVIGQEGFAPLSLAALRRTLAALPSARS